LTYRDCLHAELNTRRDTDTGERAEI
jgi:hypothetical protein